MYCRIERVELFACAEGDSDSVRSKSGGGRDQREWAAHEGEGGT